MLGPPLLSTFDPGVESEGSVDPLSLAPGTPVRTRRAARRHHGGRWLAVARGHQPRSCARGLLVGRHPA